MNQATNRSRVEGDYFVSVFNRRIFERKWEPMCRAPFLVRAGEDIGQTNLPCYLTKCAGSSKSKLKI